MLRIVSDATTPKVCRAMISDCPFSIMEIGSARIGLREGYDYISRRINEIFTTYMSPAGVLPFPPRSDTRIPVFWTIVIA